VVQSDGEAIVSAGDIPYDTELEIPLRLALVGGRAGSKLSIEGRLTFRSPAGHELETLLNRVSVRFMAKGKFDLREGVVAPVVEHVLLQMRAASVLGLARSIARKPEEREQRARISLESMRDYASLLGDERAEQEVMRIEERFYDLNASPVSSKNAVADAFYTQRSSKKFGSKP